MRGAHSQSAFRRSAEQQRARERPGVKTQERSREVCAARATASSLLPLEARDCLYHLSVILPFCIHTATRYPRQLRCAVFHRRALCTIIPSGALLLDCSVHSLALLSLLPVRPAVTLSGAESFLWHLPRFLCRCQSIRTATDDHHTLVTRSLPATNF